MRSFACIVCNNGHLPPKFHGDAMSVQKAFISVVTAVMGTGADIIHPLPGNHGDARCCRGAFSLSLFFSRSSVEGSEDNEQRNVRKVNLFTLIIKPKSTHVGVWLQLSSQPLNL